MDGRRPGERQYGGRRASSLDDGAGPNRVSLRSGSPGDGLLHFVEDEDAIVVTELCPCGIPLFGDPPGGRGASAGQRWRTGRACAAIRRLAGRASSCPPGAAR